MNISILLICVKHTEYLRVSSLCLMRRTYQKTRSVSAMLKVLILFFIFRVEYLRSWDLCLSYWISQSLSFVSSVKYLRAWDLCQMCWISQVLGSVFVMLNISDLKICVFRVKYLSPWDLCHHLVKISDPQCCVNREEYLRVISLCCMYILRVSSLCHIYWISQSLKSVSAWWISQYSWSVSNV